MKRVFYIAQREFLATVATKGFVLGLVVPLVVMGVLIVVFPRLMNEKAPRIEGEVAILDPTGQVAEGVREYLSADAIARRRQSLAKTAVEAVPESVKPLAGQALSEEAARKALERVLGEVPRLSVLTVPAGADLQGEKAPLKEGKGSDKGRLALAVIHSDAVARAAGNLKYGSYDLFVRAKLDDRIEDEIRDALREAIVSARVRAGGFDRGVIESIIHVDRKHSTTVTAEGERKTNEVMNFLFPMAFMVLLFTSVMVGSQNLLTTTIEEKSSRVVEVLLSAVSPMQLMTGKVLGQMCAGLVVLLVYAGMGLGALVSFALVGLLDWHLLVYLLVFFLLSYSIVASMMAAIGSAVNEMREAQTLMAPVMMVLTLPWMLWFPISRNPNSTFSTAISFVPPINSFAMLLRVTSNAPPPAWQVWLSIGIGVAAAYVALWGAAKIFRIGLLMFGKPPNFATLIRWIRMA